MIVFLQIIYLTMQQVYSLFQKKLSCNGQKGFDENYFEESKVKYLNACTDAEAGIKFDPPAYIQRYTQVQDVLLNEKWRDKIVKVVDFGCAELKFFTYLKHLINIQEVLLVDIDEDLLTTNAFRVKPFSADYLNRRSKPLHVEVIQGSVDTPDPKLLSVDAVICIELVEHLYPDTLDALPHNIFHFIQPRIALITTPNSDFNELFPNFSGMRHHDHKFEWNREQFQDWAQNIVERYPNYSVYYIGIGPGPKGTEHLGCCSQMAVFVQKELENEERKNLVEKLKEITDLSLKDCENSFDFISYGVCTYQSYVANLFPSDKYKIIYEFDQPHEIDNRTEEEIILHETEYRLHRLASSKKHFNHQESDEISIPLYELTSNSGGEYISASELKTILEKAGWKLEEQIIHDIPTLCVIYETSPSVSSVYTSSPNLNFSTEANWDSGSQWDLQSTENWDDMDGEVTKPSKEYVNSHEPSHTRVNEENPESDPCVSGEQPGPTDERVELLFDSGYQISTSSIELSPENIGKDWISDEKEVLEAEVKSTKSDSKQCRSKEEEENASGMKSEGHIFKFKKRVKVKIEEAQPYRPPVIVLPLPPAEVENRVVENGDLANNNRDLEGNNYQAVENHVVQNDNAIPRPENLDEHNENHIVIVPEVQVQDEIKEDEDDDNLEDASREVLFDPNSELNLDDDSIILQGQSMPLYDYDLDIPLLQRFPATPRICTDENFRTPMGFPAWLLQMLNINREEVESLESVDEENAHFYSQGDGVGVHPSTTEVSEDSTSSASTSTTNTVERINLPVVVTSGTDITSGTESHYEDALDYITTATNTDTDQTDDNHGEQSTSRDTGQGQ